MKLKSTTKPVQEATTADVVELGRAAAQLSIDALRVARLAAQVQAAQVQAAQRKAA